MATTRINYANKVAGNLWTSQDANQVKDVVNNNADELDALLTRTNQMSQQIFSSQVAQTETTVSIEANVLNVWATPVESLDITLLAGTSGRENEYKLQFTVDGNAFALTLPSGIRWLSEPEWEDGYTYQVSIENNLAVHAGWEAATS